MLNKLIFATLLVVSIQAQAGETASDNYKAYCIQCHGMEGNGKGVNVPDMSVVPRDHTDLKSMSARSDDELFKVIKEGGAAISKSELMPSWSGTFSDEEIKDLVLHLRKLCKCKYGS
ncbi:MAG: cytochrome c [Gallionellaceae bacterium]